MKRRQEAAEAAEREAREREAAEAAAAAAAAQDAVDRAAEPQETPQPQGEPPPIDHKYRTVLLNLLEFIGIVHCRLVSGGRDR